MQAFMEPSVLLGIFHLGGGEIILVLALLLILFCSKQLPVLARWLGRFSRNIDFGDKKAREAGESLGGIYGKPAAEALTPDNEVAELYKPAALEPDTDAPERRGNFVLRVFQRWWRWIRSLVCRCFCGFKPKPGAKGKLSFSAGMRQGFREFKKTVKEILEDIQNIGGGNGPRPA